MLTLYPAKQLRIDDKVGSLESVSTVTSSSRR